MLARFAGSWYCKNTMSLLAPPIPVKCNCATKLFPKIADVQPHDPSRLKPWESFPTASFGADAGAQPNVTIDTSGMKSPLMFFMTLGAGVLVGYVAGTMKSPL
jgi:hypothetical protein